MKRLADLLLSVVLIIALLPLMFVIGVIIKIDSSGPVFFHTYRIGKEAKLFYYFKFRSMFVGTEKVTNFGVFIRRWHLDELPELFLVLTGKMSLVGPRPLPKCAIKKYPRLYYESLKVKPGITGPFQINRSRTNTIEEVIYQNNWYVRNLGFLTDIIIILKTPFAIIKRKGGAKETFKIL